MAMGDSNGPGSRGECTDNIVSAVGIILEKTQSLQLLPDLRYQIMWEQWLNYLPLRDDLVSSINSCNYDYLLLMILLLTGGG